MRNTHFADAVSAALGGDEIIHPSYAVYDVFIGNDSVNWQSLFAEGLGVITHVKCIDETYPHLEIRTEVEEADDHTRIDVYWATEIGELHEYYIKDKNSPLLPWRIKYFISTKEDYRIMRRALEDGVFNSCNPKPLFPFPDYLNVPQDHQFPIVTMDRTAFQKIQIDYVGLDKFAFDVMERPKEFLDLLELMNEQTLQKFRVLETVIVPDVKLWENMSIEVFGPTRYTEYLMPVYQKIMPIVKQTGKRLHVHYDGKMKLITDQIRTIGFDGLDSFTGTPEGDMTPAEARQAFGDIFLWIHPSLSWFKKTDNELLEYIDTCVAQTEYRRFCFVLSEDVPPDVQRKLTLILRKLL